MAYTDQEDGMGFSGLVPSKSERQSERSRSAIGQEGLDVREINMLEREGFATVRAFCDAKPVDFAAIRYFGEATQERLLRIQRSVRKEIAGLSPKRSTRLEAIERALRGDLN